MDPGYRARTWAALTAVFLLLCTADPGSGEEGSRRGGVPSPHSGEAKSVRLSLKISAAKQRKRQVSFYKSVARQAKIRTSVPSRK
ncbi:MAG: hypothetical protein H6Q82_742 [Deltaproteobacteria bacterium]|nr:hypothetical protein [Deltaproteobacteria bacterium]MBP2683459.1 hypothetical protein [Deltaproteobacteria bacterium]MBP2685190.1 hypothetical protein [Deltaproteobacteria bacterium]